MARRVRRVWFAVLGETSDLSWMDDSTEQGGPQALRTVHEQAGICGPKSEAKVKQGFVEEGGVVVVWWVDWEETGTWGRSRPGLPGLISLRLSSYGNGQQGGGRSCCSRDGPRLRTACAGQASLACAEVCAGPSAWWKHRRARLAHHDYSIMICLVLACPAMPCHIEL